MNCSGGYANCFFQVPLACLGSMAEGSWAGTSVQLWENSFQMSLDSSFCLLVYQKYLQSSKRGEGWQGRLLLLLSSHLLFPIAWKKNMWNIFPSQKVCPTARYNVLKTTKHLTNNIDLSAGGKRGKTVAFLGALGLNHIIFTCGEVWGSSYS